MNHHHNDPRERARRRDTASRRLSNFTVGLAAAGAVGTGAIFYTAAAHAAHAATPPSGSATGGAGATTSTGSSGGTGSTGSSGGTSSSSTARNGAGSGPAAPQPTQAPPVATTSGS